MRDLVSGSSRLHTGSKLQRTVRFFSVITRLLECELLSFKEHRPSRDGRLAVRSRYGALVGHMNRPATFPHARARRHCADASPVAPKENRSDHRKPPALPTELIMPRVVSGRHGPRAAAASHLRRTSCIALLGKAAGAPLCQRGDIGILNEIRASIVNPPHAVPVRAAMNDGRGQRRNPEFSHRKRQCHA